MAEEPPQRDTKEDDMTVLEKKAASGLDVRGLITYVVVGVISVAIGVGVGLGIGKVSAETFSTETQQAMVERGAAVGAHLDSIWQTGLVQKEAIEEAGLLESRIHTGMVQLQAIQSADAPKRAMEMRGAETAAHLETLMRVGAAMQDLYGR